LQHLCVGAVRYLVLTARSGCKRVLHRASWRPRLHDTHGLRREQALAGLKGDESSLLMMPSMVDVIPDGCAAGHP